MRRCPCCERESARLRRLRVDAAVAEPVGGVLLESDVAVATLCDECLRRLRPSVRALLRLVRAAAVAGEGSQ
jgi:hypothetical protein